MRIFLILFLIMAIKNSYSFEYQDSSFGFGGFFVILVPKELSRYIIIPEVKMMSTKEYQCTPLLFLSYRY